MLLRHANCGATQRWRFGEANRRKHISALALEIGSARRVHTLLGVFFDYRAVCIIVELLLNYPRLPHAILLAQRRHNFRSSSQTTTHTQHTTLNTHRTDDGDDDDNMIFAPFPCHGDGDDAVDGTLSLSSRVAIPVRFRSVQPHNLLLSPKRKCAVSLICIFMVGAGGGGWAKATISVCVRGLAVTFARTQRAKHIEPACAHRTPQPKSQAN